MFAGPQGVSSPAAPGISGPTAEFPHARFATRVAIFHGNRMTAELLHAYCVMRWDCQVVAVTQSAESARQIVERGQPDVVIVGHAVPTLNCFELLPRVRAGNSSLKTIAIIAELSDYLVHKLSQASFNGVIEESSEGLLPLQNAIEQVRAGHRFLSPKFVQIAGRLRADPDSFPKVLTGRQEEVLVCIAHAMDDEEIARTLHLSPATAQRHRTDILRKLGLRSTPRLIRYGSAAGFTDVPVPKLYKAGALS